MIQGLSIATQAGAGADTNVEWRWAILSLATCAILLTISLTALGIYLFRKKTGDRTPLYFGVFVFLYAVRLFMRNEPLLTVFGITPGVAGHIERFITFTISLPNLFLFLEIVQARWRRILLWALGVQLVFAAVAIPCDFLGIARREIDIANSLLVLASWILLIALLFFLRPPGQMPRDLRVVAVGLGVLALFVIHANLTGLHIVGGRDLEPAGFLFFVCTLGYLVAHRIFTKEESLFAIQKELEIAEQIQTSILPREVPRRTGIEIAARYLPMSAVAGDFYDFLTSDRNYLGILIADVTGHGVPAALIASMLKVAYASQAAHADDPALVLAGLNKALCGKFEDHFVTAAYLYVDLDAKLLRYAGAGHPPLLYKNRSNGEARSIEHNGLFLGMFPEAEYSSMEIPLKPGDRYALYTDGLPETKNASSEEFGVVGCLKVLDSHTTLSAGALADQMLSEISRWSTNAKGSAGSQDDDMTLIVLDCQE